MYIYLRDATYLCNDSDSIIFSKFPKRNNLPNSLCHSSTQSASNTTVDPEEVRRFQALASKWWDEQGEFAALHSLNDLRVPFIRCVFK